MTNTAQYGRRLVPQNISCLKSKSEFWDQSFLAWDADIYCKTLQFIFFFPLGITLYSL